MPVLGNYSLLKVESLPENMRGEGHSAAGWSIGGSVELLLPVSSFGQ